LQCFFSACDRIDVNSHNTKPHVLPDGRKMRDILFYTVSGTADNFLLIDNLSTTSIEFCEFVIKTLPTGEQALVYALEYSGEKIIRAYTEEKGKYFMHAFEGDKEIKIIQTGYNIKVERYFQQPDE
jgi:hypothetical protein